MPLTKQIENPQLSRVSPWDAAPRSIETIRAIGDAGVDISRKLLNKISQLQEEFTALGSKDPELLPTLLKKFRSKYAYHTISIEGNTLTESQTTMVIEYGTVYSKKSYQEHVEARNIPKALDLLVALAKETKATLRTSDILELHKATMNGIDGATPGYFRKGFVGIRESPYVPPPAYELDHLINEMVKHANKNPLKLTPLALSFKLHLWFVSIHPFGDGNGRVGRLIAGLVQYKDGFPPIIVKVEHDDRYRKVLRRAQLRAHGKLDLKPYYRFMAEEYIATLTEYIATAKQEGPADNIIALADAAKTSGIDVDYLGQLARSAVIPAFKNGGRWMVRVKDIENYVSRRNTRELLLPRLKRTQARVARKGNDIPPPEPLPNQAHNTNG